MNAVIFQVRPACDAFYESPYEPWSSWLTGAVRERALVMAAGEKVNAFVRYWCV